MTKSPQEPCIHKRQRNFVVLGADVVDDVVVVVEFISRRIVEVGRSAQQAYMSTDTSVGCLRP